ncbi:SAM-dependent methyltransferase [Streptomyces sp. NPDC049040]|uniref:SAM-dependent methyltransferase n=1 Tax=Streptomyces sp. NPDC049040 TaxID=3365593 RepID=UPI0037164CCF
MTPSEPGTHRVDTTVPHSARVYDYFLGGKTNYPVDEALAKQVLLVDSTVTDTVRANRRFMQRATRQLAQEAGIRQFIDIGTGIPTEPNLHQIAQQAAPDSRVVYVDNDPIVLRHAEALLDSTPEGATDYVEADVRDPARIMEQAGQTLDFSRPVALSAVALLHFVPDEDDAHGIVRRLMEPLAPGSHLVVAHVTGDFDPDHAAEVVEIYRRQGTVLRPRTKAEAAAFFDGLVLTDPGLVLAPEWRPDRAEEEAAAASDGAVVPVWVGVARKP